MNTPSLLSVSTRRLTRRAFFAAILAAWILAAVGLRAAEPRTSFAESTRPLSSQAAAARRALTTSELAGQMDIGVILSLRNADELQTRINRNEIVPYAEMEQRYLPRAEDHETVLRWLRAEGFTITRADDSRMGIYVRGTVAQVQKSFQVELAHVTVDGVGYPAAVSVPSLPASVAASVKFLAGLHPYLQLRPFHREVPFRAKGPGIQTNDFILHPATTYPQRSYSPAQIITAFDAASLTGFDGTGERIAILADVLPATSDLTAFWTRQGVTRTGVIETSTPNGTTGTTTPGIEVTLDAEWSSSIAPGANVRIYAAGSTQFGAFGTCLQQMINDFKAGTKMQQLSISYGLGEVDAGSGAGSYFISFDNQYMLVLTGLGVTIFASTGDDGSTFTQVSGGTAATQVSYYSSSPNIAAVGGTSLGVNANGTRSGEDAWSGSGGGASIVFSRPSWQTGTGVPAGTFRLVPDVCLPADPNTGCNLTFQGKIYDYNGNTSGFLEGGTSWSSPTWAGFMARINQARANNSPARGLAGLLMPRIYPLIGTNNFFDITSGSNGSFSATAGYDETTGIGSPDVANLLVTLLGPTITNLAPASGVAGTSVVITGTNFYKVTSVTFNGTAAASYTVNSATQITATVPSGVTTGPVVVTASGDTATSSTNFTLAVPDLKVVSAHAGNFKAGDNGDVYTLTVSNVGTLASSGTVTLTDALDTANAYIVSASGTGWTCVVGSAGSTRTCTCTRSDALAASASYPAITLTVNVSPNGNQQFNNKPTISNASDTNANNNSFTDATTVATVTDTPTRDWRYQYFGTTANSGSAADTANPSGDGLSNLAKYALGLDPTKATANPVTSDTSTGYLRLTAPKNPNATDVTYTVQATDDLTNPAGWSTNGTTLLASTTTSLQVRDNTPYPPASGSVERFLRLLISR